MAKKDVDPMQAWFWMPNWQAGERKADADRLAARVEHFGSGEELLATLQSIAKPADTP